MRKYSKLAVYIAATALCCSAASAYTLTFDDIPLARIILDEVKRDTPCF